MVSPCPWLSSMQIDYPSMVEHARRILALSRYKVACARIRCILPTLDHAYKAWILDFYLFLWYYTWRGRSWYSSKFSNNFLFFDFLFFAFKEEMNLRVLLAISSQLCPFSKLCPFSIPSWNWFQNITFS